MNVRRTLAGAAAAIVAIAVGGTVQGLRIPGFAFLAALAILILAGPLLDVVDPGATAARRLLRAILFAAATAIAWNLGFGVAWSAGAWFGLDFALVVAVLAVAPAAGRKLRPAYSRVLARWAPDAPAPGRSRGGGNLWLPLATTATVAAVYYLIAAAPGAPMVSRDPAGYYPLQAEGFLHGHLYAAIDPAPGLLALANPYDPVANAPYRVHDMSLWQGHYYLYFGAAPALLWVLPLRMLTGYYPSDPASVALFCAIGFGFAAQVLARIRRHYFPNTSSLVAASLHWVLGIGSPVLLLNLRAEFYQVPISCAYALGMAAFWTILRAAESSRPARWLALAGSLLGLSLAARPNYLLAAAAIALPAWWLARNPDIREQRRRLVRHAVAAFAPIAAAGIGILAYNALRFGNPLEFGMRYQLAGEVFLNLRPLGLANLLPHAAEYLGGKAWWLPYFPYFHGLPDFPAGLVRYCPFVWLALPALAMAARTERSPAEPLRLFILSTSAIALGNLTMISLFFGHPQLRYGSDYAGGVLLVAAVGGLALAASRPGSRIVSAGLCVLALVSSIPVVGTLIDRAGADTFSPALARLGDYPAAWLEKALGDRYGALRLSLRVAPSPTADTITVVRTGFSSDGYDRLLFRVLPDGLGQFSAYHDGLGEIGGKSFPIPADRILAVEYRSGALLPPVSHPFFRDWKTEEAVSARRKLQIRVNGTTVLDAALQAYPNAPHHWEILPAAGRPRGGSVEVVESERLDLPREPSVPTAIPGVREPRRLRFQLPAVAGSFEPLIMTGTGEKSDLLYVAYGPADTIRLGFDHYGQSGVVSEPLKYDPTREQELQVWMGSWETEGGGSSGRQGQLLAVFNGQVALNSPQQFYNADSHPTMLGANPSQFGTAGPTFTGRLLSFLPADDPSLAPLRTDGAGAVRMRVKLREAPLFPVEPLVVAGKSPATDVIYIRYLSNGQVAFGARHGATASEESSPVSVPRNLPFWLEIRSDALLGRLSAGAARGAVEVRIDGRSAWAAEVAQFRTDPEDIHVTVRPTAAGTDPWFSAEILRLERP